MRQKKKGSQETQPHDNTSASQRFFSKVGDYFSPEPQKEKVLRHEDFNRAGDTYYATVSVGYKILQRIILLILVVFLLISLVTNFREITYDNFFYLVKDFSAVADTGSASRDILSYDSNTRHTFSLYKGGLTVANPANISVFTATGRKTFSTASKYSSPCIEASDKYFIIYDTSGGMFAVYNSFARVYDEEFEYPVTSACFAPNGYMAVVTRDMSHRSLVHVYNKNFKKQYTVPSDKYVFDVCMNYNSDRLVICYYGIGDGSGQTEIVVRDLINHEISNTVVIDGEFLLDSGFLDNGYFAVITDRSVRIYDKYFEELDAYEYDNGVVSAFEINDQGVAVSYTLNSGNSAIVFDKTGNLVYNESINDNIRDVGIFDRYVFLRTDSGVVRIDTKNLYDQSITCAQGKLLIYSANTVLVCGDSKAEYLKFED